MEIFGIGPLELVLIVLIALIVLGPKEMMTTAQKAATWLRKLRNSEIWSSTKEVMDIPNQVLHESGLDKEIRELQTLSRKGVAIPTTWKPDASLPPVQQPGTDPAVSAPDSQAAQPTPPVQPQAEGDNKVNGAFPKDDNQ